MLLFLPYQSPIVQKMISINAVRNVICGKLKHAATIIMKQIVWITAKNTRMFLDYVVCSK